MQQQLPLFSLTDERINFRVLTTKGGRFVGTECIVLLGEESAAGACCSVSKQVGGGPTGRSEAKASTCGGSGWLAEGAGSKQAA